MHSLSNRAYYIRISLMSIVPSISDTRLVPFSFSIVHPLPILTMQRQSLFKGWQDRRITDCAGLQNNGTVMQQTLLLTPDHCKIKLLFDIQSILSQG